MKSKLRRMLAVPALAAALALGVTSPAGAAAQREPAARPVVTGPDRGHANQLISSVENDRGTFGGISFDQKTGTATIRYDDAAGEHAARARLGSLTAQRANGWRVVLRQVPHSLAELDNVRRQVATDPAWQAVAGKVLSKWYIDVESNRVAIGVTALTPDLTSTAAAVFGDKASLHVADRPARASRLDDFEPWTAGIRINLNPGGGCSSGFIIRSVATPDQRRLVSAGHCGSLGATVRNNGDLVGTVVERQLAQNGLDYAHVGGRAYQAWMYTGGPASNVGLPIKGTTLSGVGIPVCTNGATSGENCAGEVSAIDVCVTFSDGITTCFLDEARSTNGSSLFSPGDSGGPVIAFDTEGLKVVGIIIGGNATMYFHSYHYLVPAGWVVDTM